MKLFTNRSLIILLLLAFTAGGCGLFGSDDKDDDGFEDGISQDIRDIISDEHLTVLEDSLKVPIHRGSNPPFIEGAYSLQSLKNEGPQVGITFVMAPLIMLETVVPDDSFSPGSQFLDLYFRFSNQEIEELTIDMDMKHLGEENHQAFDAFIIGEGDNFTIATETLQIREETEVRRVNIFSATIAEDGVAEAHYAFIMTDNGEFPDLIPNGTGRSFEDGQGMSSVTEWPESEEQGKSEPGSKFGIWHLMMK